MQTVMLGKQKGGVSASTLCRELAVCAAFSGKTVALVDLDPQRTLSKWWHTRQANLPPTSGEQANPCLIDVSHAGLTDALAQLGKAGVDLVIIDSPPSIHEFVIDLAATVDLVLAPVRASKDDLDALNGFISELKPGTEFAFIITQSMVQARRLYMPTFTQLAELGRVAPPLHYRTDYAEASSYGTTAFEASGTKASAEVAEIYRWLSETLLRKKPATTTSTRKRSK